MLIGVISDTHDRTPAIRAAIELFAARKAEAMIHAGDFIAPFAAKALLDFQGPIYATFGNNDGEKAGLKKQLPQLADGPLWVGLGGRAILVHHYLGWCRPEEVAAADIVITGHTHEVVNRLDGHKLILNPGECCGWQTGRCTVALLDTEGPSAEVCELQV
jgi:hypothetical protein